MNKVEKKRQKEQYVVEEMIRLYCRKNYSCKRHVVNKRFCTDDRAYRTACGNYHFYFMFS